MFPTIEIFVSNVRTLHYMHVNIFDRPIIEIATTQTNTMYERDLQ